MPNRLQCEVTDEGVGKLAAGCPQLSSLDLLGCSEVTHDGVGQVAHDLVREVLVCELVVEHHDE